MRIHSRIIIKTADILVCNGVMVYQISKIDINQLQGVVPMAAMRLILTFLFLLSVHAFSDSNPIDFPTASPPQYRLDTFHDQLNNRESIIHQQEATPLNQQLEMIGSSSSEEHDSEHSEEQSKHAVKIPGIGLSILFIFGALLYGSLLKLVSRYTSIPYNPLLLVSGIAMGLYYDHLSILGEAILLVSKAEPHGVLAIFLPILIFQGAFKTQWHVFKKFIGQSLIIGVLSSIVGALLVMLAIKLFIDTNNVYFWHEALLMGSILTCTDVLSFIIKLKRGGTPQKITAVIEGQSLFNYCTCVLIFQFISFSRRITQIIEFWGYLSLLIEQVFGGIIFGVVMGVIGVYCIKRMIYDGVLVVTITIIFCYTIYLAAEFSSLRVSGIISLAVFSLYMNAFGKTWLFGETGQYVNSFWNYMSFVAQTSIFMIAGVFVGVNLISIEETSIKLGQEFTITIYIYIAVFLSRFLSIGAFMHYLKNLADGLNWREVIVLTFAGLKGAIGISLAMHVYENQHFEKTVGSLLLFHVATNSLLTLVIQGITTSWVVKGLGVSTIKKVEYKFFKEYLYSFQGLVRKKFEKLKMEKGESYTMADWEAVEREIGLDQYDQMEKTVADIISQNMTVESKFGKTQIYKLENVIKDYVEPDEEMEIEGLQKKDVQFDLQVQFRKRFIKDLIATYWQFHEKNFTTPAALMLLIQSATIDLNKETQEIQSWNWIKNEVSFNMRIFSQLMKVTLISHISRSYLFQYVSFCYDVVSSYIKANQQVRLDLLEFYEKSVHQNEDEQSKIMINVLRESEENQKQAQFFLKNYLQPSFPEIEREVKTRKVSFFILHSFKSIIDDNNENGQLEPNQYEFLNQIIDSKSLQLNLSTPEWQQSDLFQILKENSLFKSLPDPILQLLATELGQEHTFDANQRIIDNNQIAKHFYFIKKGGCTIQFTNESIVYKQPMLAGETFGFQSLVTNIFHSKATANTMAEIVQIKKSLIIRIFDAFPQFEALYWKAHIFHCYKMFVKKDDLTYRIGHFQQQQLKEIIDSFCLMKIQPRVIQALDRDMIFIRGHVEVIYNDEGPIGSNKKIEEKERLSLPQNNPYTAYPFQFISRLDQVVIKVKQPSIFLVGELDYQIFQKLSTRLSKMGSKMSKKKSML